MEDKSLVVSRVLAMTTYIGKNPGITVGELAKQFGLTEKQAERDIALIDQAGWGDLYPDEMFALDYDLYINERRLQLVQNLSVEAPPKLTTEEMVLLTGGLSLIETSLSAEQIEIVPTLLAKLLALADAPGVKISVNTETGGAGYYRQAANAIRAGVQARIRYQSPSGQSSRTIDPHRLVQLDDGWLLYSWCHEAKAPRSFRLDRILDWVTLDEAITSPEISQESAEVETCTVYLRPQALWRISDWPQAKVAKDGQIEICFEVSRREWMIARIEQMGEDVVATEPASWLEQARDHAQEVLSIWEGLGSSGR